MPGRGAIPMPPKPQPVSGATTTGAYPGTGLFLPMLMVLGIILVAAGTYLISVGTVAGIFGGIFAILFGLFFFVLLLHAA